MWSIQDQLQHLTCRPSFDIYQLNGRFSYGMRSAAPDPLHAPESGQTRPRSRRRSSQKATSEIAFLFCFFPEWNSRFIGGEGDRSVSKHFRGINLISFFVSVPNAAMVRNCCNCGVIKCNSVTIYSVLSA